MKEFSPKLDHRYDLEPEKRAKRRERLQVIPGSVAVVAALFYWGDVHSNYTEAQTSVPSVDVFYEPEQPTDSVTIFFPGMGENDGWRLASLQGPVTNHVLNDEWWSMNYGNAFLNEEKMSEKILALMKERGKHTASIYGYSAGGVISLETIVPTLEESNIRLESIWLDSVPVGSNGIQPEQQELRDFMLSVVDVAPSAQYSSVVRYLGEMAFRSDQFLSGGYNNEKFWKVSNFVTEGLEDGRIAGTWLVIDQVLTASHGDVEDSLKKIAKLTQDEPDPLVVSFATAEPGRDRIVNSTGSSKNTCLYSNELGFPCFRYDIPGAVHNLPEAANAQYHEITENAAPELKAAIARNLLRYYQGFYEPVTVEYSAEQFTRPL